MSDTQRATRSRSKVVASSPRRLESISMMRHEKKMDTRPVMILSMAKVLIGGSELMMKLTMMMIGLQIDLC